jgi:predicted CxxxxCH...CXXCH cytochrome family protein
MTGRKTALSLLLLAAMLCSCAEEIGQQLGAGDGADAAVTDGGKTDVVAGDGSPPISGDGPRDHGAAIGDGAAASCASGCHGSKANTAPPASVKGQSATSARGVGAHQAHLKSATWHVQVVCSDCHKVPKTVTEPGHVDTAMPAEVLFSPAAKQQGAAPSWDGTRCSGGYCHGGTLSGGKVTAPVWTKVDGSQIKCDSCHGDPPTKSHTASDTQCSACHAAVVDKNKKIIAPALHIDGKVSAAGGHPAGYGDPTVHAPDFFNNPTGCGACHGANLTGGSAKGCGSCHKQQDWLTSCVYCHGGTVNQTGAPPEDVAGKTATSAPGVGRHTTHVAAGNSHNAFSCVTCHGKSYKSALDPGHVGPAPADLAFTGLAKGSTYSFTTRWCSNVYCHGNGKPGSGGSALWTGSLSGGCSACHDDETDGSNMTLSGEHKKHLIDLGRKCVNCHGCVVSGSKLFVDKSKHVNGKPDVCDPTWNPTTKSCSTPGKGCHSGQPESW